MQYIVYLCYFPNNKYYVGITSKKLNDRIRKHLNTTKNGSKYKFHNALRKYKHLCKWEIIEKNLSKEEACFLENYYIKHYDSYKKGYNSTLGGEGVLAVEFSKETRKKLSIKQSGKNNSMYNKKHSIESKIKMRNSISRNRAIICITNNNRYNSINEAARQLNISAGNIVNVLSKRYKQTNGYIFEYIEEKVC